MAYASHNVLLLSFSWYHQNCLDGALDVRDRRHPRHQLQGHCCSGDKGRVPAPLSQDVALHVSHHLIKGATLGARKLSLKKSRHSLNPTRQANDFLLVVTGVAGISPVSTDQQARMFDEKELCEQGGFNHELRVFRIRKVLIET